MQEKLKIQLKQHGYSATKSRLLVFGAFTETHNPVTMAQLIKKLHNDVDRASIYRIIDVFEKTGVVSRLQIGWKYKLELTDIFQRHHHHMTCTNCGATISFHETSQLEAELELISKNARFKLQSHSLELIGLCESCEYKLSKP